MARIRTIKPEFFRHEALQDLEYGNMGSCCMLVFQGLWTQCDNQGVFPYQPRQLKLDILPFLPFDMQNTLTLLENYGFLKSYSVSGKQYGIIPSFPDHQRFTGKEAGEDGKKYPAPSVNDLDEFVKHQGNIRETSGKDQSFTNVQEREREREKEIKTSSSHLPTDPPKPKPEPKKPKAFLSDSDEIRLSEYLFKHIKKNNPDAKQPDLQLWAKHIDLMIRLDGRTVDQIKNVVAWCQKDPFWKCNILSTKTLRDKYDQLKVKMNGNGTSSQDENKCNLPLFVAGDESWFKNPVYSDD